MAPNDLKISAFLVAVSSDETVTWITQTRSYSRHPVGGKVKDGETIVEGLRREVAEEIGATAPERFCKNMVLECVRLARYDDGYTNPASGTDVWLEFFFRTEISAWDVHCYDAIFTKGPVVLGRAGQAELVSVKDQHTTIASFTCAGEVAKALMYKKDRARASAMFSRGAEVLYDAAKPQLVNCVGDEPSWPERTCFRWYRTTDALLQFLVHHCSPVANAKFALYGSRLKFQAVSPTGRVEVHVL